MYGMCGIIEYYDMCTSTTIILCIYCTSLSTLLQSRHKVRDVNGTHTVLAAHCDCTAQSACSHQHCACTESNTTSHTHCCSHSLKEAAMNMHTMQPDMTLEHEHGHIDPPTKPHTRACLHAVSY
jgi:hypothetical protein